MFNQGLIITNAFTVWPCVHHMVKRLTDEFKAFGIKMDNKSNSEILTYIDSNGNVKAEDMPYDFIIFLDKDYYISTMLEKAGYRLFNKAESIRYCDDKMLTHLMLTNNGIRMPLTIPFPLKYAEASKDAFLDNVMKILKFPFIVKEIYGSLGEQVHLVHNKEELYAAEEIIKDRPHIYQEYIASSFGTDMRVVVIGGKAVANMHRVAQNEGEFRSNIETGGIGLHPVLEKRYIDVAEKVAKLLDLDYCGLDLLFDENKDPILCEVNANAYLEPIEKYSGENVALMYVKHIYNKVYSK